MAYGWEGEKVRLVPMDRERHLANAQRWINDPEVTHWLGGEGRPMTRAAEESWFAHHDANPKDEIQFAVETLEGVHLGFSGLMEIDERNGKAVCGTLLGARDLWGRGYGSDAARVRARYAFEVRGLRMLTSKVFAPNERSLGMLKNAGFVEYGRLPQGDWIRGAYVDDVLLVLTRERWLSLAKP